MMARIENGEADQFIDQMVPLESRINEHHWKAIEELTCKLLARARKEHGVDISFPDVNRYANRWAGAHWNPHKLAPGGSENVGDQKILVDEVPVRGIITRSVVISQGPVQCNGIFTENIVFANGSVTTASSSVGNSVIFADGDITVENPANCLLMATGRVYVKGKAKDCVIVEKSRQPLGLLKAFDTSQVGIQVKESDGAVVVENVAAGEPFAKAGFRVGDRITTAEKIRLSNPEQFRRPVRRQAMAAEPLNCKIHRPGVGEVEIRVPLTD
jgi:PDZ domain